MNVSMGSKAPEIQGWLQIATSLGFTGLAWFLIMVTLPDMQAKFDAHSDKMFTRFEEQMNHQRDYSERVIEGIVTRYENHLGRLSNNGN